MMVLTAAWEPMMKILTGTTLASLAATLGIERTNVYRWVHERRDPTSETLVDIVKALRTLNSAAAETFVQKYLGDVAQGLD